MSEEKKKKKLIDRLKTRFRLVVLNDESFEEKFSLRLTPGGLLILIGSITLVMTFGVVSLVAFTPIREYIPGYGEIGLRKQLIDLNFKVDSLEESMESKNWFIQNLNNVIHGNLEKESQIPAKDSTKNYKDIDIRPGQQDSALRLEIEKKNRYTLAFGNKGKGTSSITSYFFFSPLHGMVTGSFNLKDEHYGVDIAGKENELIKSTLDGTVIYSGWNSTEGHVLQIQHSNNLLSIYKHNSDLLKKTGDYVKAGEPVAVIGDTGETSNGLHLHFELWYNGNPLNPQDYIVF